ncbi:MAG: alanine racemase [Deltaproteobacteria bacterium]|nr:alanine racemase [Deltaproteobacteria bacterium]
MSAPPSDPEHARVAPPVERRASPRRHVRPTRIEVDLDAILANVASVRALTGVPVHAVVKADGYGHGATAVARALVAHRAVGGLCVSLVEEGVAIHDAGVVAPTLVMGPAQAGGEDEMIARAMTPVVSDPGDVERLVAAVARRGRPVEIHLKVDTGMTRLGVAIDQLAAIVARAQAGGLIVVGLMTHFACADSDDPADPGCMTYAQLAAFERATAIARGAGAPITVRHTANSSGAMLFPAARFDRVRPGIAIYGNGHWATDAQAAPRRQAMRLCTEVVQIHEVAAGTPVGYGALWRAPRATRLAVLPLGYADGLPRRVTGHAEVLIGGVRCPLVGAISMDIAIADIGAVPHVRPGALAVLLGDSPEGGAPISTAEYAGWSGLTEYEVTCGMSKRVPRVHVGGAGG